MTYEFEDRKERLERYEWDNVWWERTDMVNAQRVLYIGDSISCATRRRATALTDKAIMFDGFGTSKALDNSYFKDALRLFAAQEEGRRAVLFNNGLHGWHLSDDEDYRYYYEQMILFLREQFPGEPILLLLTTAISDPARKDRVVVRNRVVCELAEKYDLPVVDLYTVSRSREGLQAADGIHLTPEGYELLAQTLVDSVRAYLPQGGADGEGK